MMREQGGEMSEEEDATFQSLASDDTEIML